MKTTKNIIRICLSGFALAIVLSSCTGHGTVCDAYSSNVETDNDQNVSESNIQPVAVSYAATEE